MFHSLHSLQLQTARLVTLTERRIRDSGRTRSTPKSLSGWGDAPAAGVPRYARLTS